MAHHRTLLRHLEPGEFGSAALAARKHGPDDLRDHLARALHDHVVADAHVLGGDLVGVVQRRDAYTRPTDDDRLKDGKRREHARPADRDVDVEQSRHGLLGRELERRRPARLAADDAELALQAHVVDLHHHAVDGVGQLVAAAHPRLAERRGRLDVLEPLDIRAGGEPGVAHPRQRGRLARGALGLLHPPDLVQHEVEPPARGHRRVELAQ